MNFVPVPSTDLSQIIWEQVFQHSASSQSPISSENSYQNANKLKKPKRSKTAFILFSSETRTKFKQDPNLCEMNSNEVMVKLADLWKNLRGDEKRIFEKRAERDKARYVEELNTYRQNFPKAVIKNKTKKNHIRKPCSAYAIFLKEMKIIIKNQKPDLKMAEILKVVSRMWKNLSEENKEIYQQKSMIDKEFIKAKLCANNRAVAQEIENKEQKRVEEDKFCLREPVMKKKKVKNSNENETKPIEKVLTIEKWNKDYTPVQTTRVDSFNSFCLRPNGVIESLNFDFPELDLQSYDTGLSGKLLAEKDNLHKDVSDKTLKIIKKASEPFLDYISFETFIQKRESLENLNTNDDIFQSSTALYPNIQDTNPVYLTKASPKPSQVDSFYDSITKALEM